MHSDFRKPSFLPPIILRRRFILKSLLFLGGCATVSRTQQNNFSGKLTIGVVSYDEGLNVLTQFQSFNQYLSEQLRTNIELEPAYNERLALEQIRKHRWSLVFAPPGLCALAIHQNSYIPLFPLQGQDSANSVLVVQQDSPLQTISDLKNRAIALGQPGSVSAYYMPLYTLYGLTLKSIEITATPTQSLTLLAQGTVAAVAMGRDDYEHYRRDIPNSSFRILSQSRRIPSGSVLLSPSIERNQQRIIEKMMNQASPVIADSVGYIPNASPPDYKELMTFIDKVKPIEPFIQEQPAMLYDHT